MEVARHRVSLKKTVTAVFFVCSVSPKRVAIIQVCYNKIKGEWNSMLNEKLLDIRYVKLHFTVEFVEDTETPIYKASAIRGGMGEMLLRANCIRDRDCGQCDFQNECIVRRIMYSKMEIQPTFMSSGDSVGYVIECEDYHERFFAGEQLTFSIILFGKTIVYFSQILNALYALGINGLGKEKSRFSIAEISNTKRVPIMNGNDIDMSKFEILRVRDYVDYRRGMLPKTKTKTIIKFQSPLTIKYRQSVVKEFIPEAVIESACRRIYILDCFEGIESDLIKRAYIESLTIPDIVHEDHHSVHVKRYSNHKKSAMRLEGIEGELHIGDISEELLDILLAGELMHIGKNTSFGFGRYRLL